MNFVRSKRMLSSLLSGVMVLSLLLPVGQAAAATQGSSVVDTRRMEIGPGAVYTWMNMSKGSGEQKVHMVEFQPSQGSLELQPGMTNGKVYGMEGVSKMAADVDREGNRVIAAVNADFYDMSTGIPLGLFMGEGEILNSPQGSRVAFGIKEDGTSLFGTPTLSRSVTINGMTSALSSINRMRGNEELVLYTDKFHTSTMTNDLGDEVVLDVVNGRVASGETLTMKVVSIHHNKGNSRSGPTRWCCPRRASIEASCPGSRSGMRSRQASSCRGMEGCHDGCRRQCSACEGRGCAAACRSGHPSANSDWHEGGWLDRHVRNRRASAGLQ